MTQAGNAARSARAAASGSSASRSARTTAMPRAPADATSAMFPRSMPPIANHGTLADSAATWTSPSPASAFPGFVGVAKIVPTPM